MARRFQGLRTRKRTSRQREVLRAVLELSAELGRAPTSPEVATRLGVSRVSALEALKRLERVGALADLPRVISSGTWEVTEAGRALAEEEEPA
jgi:Mn-dependent DtxR family transcriptional regulator